MTCSRELLQYWESSNPKVAWAGTEVRMGSKWGAAEPVDITESRLRQRMLVGTVAQGRSDLGSDRTLRHDKAQGKERRLGSLRLRRCEQD